MISQLKFSGDVVPADILRLQVCGVQRWLFGGSIISFMID